MGKIMRVNPSDLKVKVEDMPREYQGLGGRGISSHIVGREVPPKADPLGLSLGLNFFVLSATPGRDFDIRISSLKHLSEKSKYL